MRIVIIALLLTAIGCKKAAPTPAPGDPAKSSPVAVAKKPSGPPGDGTALIKEPVAKRPELSNFGRRMELPELQNFYKQVGLAYQTIEADTGKAPANSQQLQNQLKAFAEMFDAEKKGWIKIAYNVRQWPEGRSSTILAWEVEPDRNGLRCCLMGDTSVQMLNVEEFDKAPKAQ